MGRTRAAQRNKKAEKAKVKLKGHTTKFLPKGKNVTDTTFKVRKIVLQEQLKTPDESQPLTNKKLNIKEVMSKLQHYSPSQRNEGLNGLSELLCQMDRSQFMSHLSTIIDGLAKLALDVDTKVRRHSAHILSPLLAMVGETQILPFSAVLASYLCCAMTHIQLEVQEDSLLLLDTLLQQAPVLAAASASQILPCVLDMISRGRADHTSSRQLSFNLSSNLSSFTWRAKVFGRLQALLLVSLENRTGKARNKDIVVDNSHHSSVPIKMDSEVPYFFPLYSDISVTPVYLSNLLHKSCKSTKQLLDDSAQLRNFAESLMPLMFDSWVEVNPLSLKKSKQKAQDNGLQPESAIILHCVLEIITLLWENLAFCEKENSKAELTDWFKERYVKDINRFLGKGFPYTPQGNLSLKDNNEGESQGLGRKRSKPVGFGDASKPDLVNLTSPLLFEDKNEPSSVQAIAKCVPQNLTLCHLLATLVKSPTVEVKEKSVEFLIACLNQWGGSLSPWSKHLLRALRSVFGRSTTWAMDLNPLLSAVIARYHRSTNKQSASHKLLASQLFDLLAEIASSQEYDHLSRCNSFSSWIFQLPASLSNQDLTIERLCMFNKLARQNNVSFLQGLQNSFTSLLDAVNDFQSKVSENVLEKEAGLASLFYWVPSWNDQQVLSLRRTLIGDQCSSSLAHRIMSIVSLRREKFQVLADAHWLID